MSVVYCAMIVKGDRFEEKSSYDQVYQHDWLVKTNNKADGVRAVRTGSLTGSPHTIPGMWTTYTNPVTGETDSGSYLQNKTISRLTNRDDDFSFWKVSCTWGPLPINTPGPLTDSNPINWATQFSLEWASHTKFVEEDIYGRKLENTAGTLFDPYEIDDDRPVLVATRNVASLTTIISLAIEYKNAINSSTFYGAPAYSAKVESIVSGTIQTSGGVSYYPMTIRVQFTNPDEWDGWDVRMANVGPECYTEDGELIRVRELNSDGTPKEDGELLPSAKLDADGVQLPPGSPGIVVPLIDAPGTDGYPWRFYRPKNFSGLGIGGS